MALAQELYGVPASRLDSFVAQRLQPSRAWKEEVLAAVHTVEQFLRQEHFQGEQGLDQEARVLKVVKVSLGPSVLWPGQGKPSTRATYMQIQGPTASLFLAHTADTSGHPS